MASILLIEDDDSSRSTIAAVLRFHGHTVIEARDGIEGVHRHAQGLGDFALVICDLVLPRRRGIEVIHALQTRPSVPILAVSGAKHALDELRARFPDGSISFLEKPFPLQDLVAAVDAMLKPGNN